MSQPARFPQYPAGPLPADDIIVLTEATWADFQRVLEMRGDRPVPRVAYLEGALELMTPSLPHEDIKSMIGCLVEAWCFERGVDISPYGSWTLEDKDVDRGIEPDECYVLGDVREPVRPDLAIEVVWSSGGINKLDIYRKLGVKEIWIWKGGTIEVFVLRADTYVTAEASEILTGIDLSLLCRFIAVKPMTRAVKEYRAALRG